MSRFIIGLGLACALIGCGDAATEFNATTTAENDAPTPPPSKSSGLVTGVADSAVLDAPVSENAELAGEEDDSADRPETFVVKFKVPGMT